MFYSSCDAISSSCIFVNLDMLGVQLFSSLITLADSLFHITYQKNL